MSQTSPHRNHTAALAATTTPAAGLPIAILHEFARDLIALPEPHDLLRRALLTAAQLTGAQHATLLLLDDQSEQIRYRVAMDNGNLAPLELVAKPMMDRGLAGWVVRAKSSALVVDTEQDERWLPGPGLGDLRSALAAPLICASQVLGVLTLGSEATGHFQAGHVALAEIIAAQAAGAIKLSATLTTGNTNNHFAQAAIESVPTLAPLRAQEMVALATELRGLSAAAARMPLEVCFEDILNVFFRTMTGIIHQYHGIMVHDNGDMLLAVYEANGGCERAARTAIRMQVTLQQLATDWHRRFGLHIGGLNIGIAQGPALLDRMIPHQATCRVVGAAITQAVRLRELARSSEILVAEEVYTALNDVRTFELTALPPLHLGAALTQNIYQLEGRHTGE